MVQLKHPTSVIRSMADAILHLDAKSNMQETSAAYAILIMMEFSPIAMVGKSFIFRKIIWFLIVSPFFSANCEWGTWSFWSSCKNCKTSRSRSVKREDEFGGQPCIGEAKEEKDCDCPGIQSMNNRYLLKFFDCLAHPKLSATFATDQTWPLCHLRISYQSLAGGLRSLQKLEFLKLIISFFHYFWCKNWD